MARHGDGRHAMPAHAGLGSGTSIALAVAAAVRALHGMPLDIARRCGAVGAARAPVSASAAS